MLEIYHSGPEPSISSSSLRTTTSQSMILHLFTALPSLHPANTKATQQTGSQSHATCQFTLMGQRDSSASDIDSLTELKLYLCSDYL